MPQTATSPRFEKAPEGCLAGVEHLAPRFFREVLEWEFEECLVTDDSDLFDFTSAVATLAERDTEVAE